jgi:hypothetical protein
LLGLSLLGRAGVTFSLGVLGGVHHPLRGAGVWLLIRGERTVLARPLLSLLLLLLLLLLLHQYGPNFLLVLVLLIFKF